MEIEEKLIDKPFNLPDEIPFRPNPNAPSWSSLEAVAVWIASVLLIVLVPMVFLLPYLALQNPPITEGSQLSEFVKSDPIAIILQVVAILPAHLLMLLLAYMVVTRVRKHSFRKSLGWETGGFAWWYYGIILGSFFVIAAVVGNFFPEQENELIRILQSSRAALYIVAFIATITAPMVEEVIYRGVLYSAFQSRFGVPAAFLLVTFLFSLVHVPQYYPSFSTIFLLTMLSLTLTAVRVLSGNLLPCIILHTIFNGLQSVLLILEPYLKTTPATENLSIIVRSLN